MEVEGSPMGTVVVLTPIGDNRLTCRLLLRHSMAALIVSVIGYCFFAASTMVLSVVGSLTAIAAGLGLLFTIPVTMAGHILTIKLERSYSPEVLRRLRVLAIVGVTTSVLGILLTSAFYIAFYTLTVATSDGSYEDEDYYRNFLAYAMMVTWFGNLSLLYYVITMVTCSLLVHVSRRAISALAVPVQPLVPAGSVKSTDMVV